MNWDFPGILLTASTIGAIKSRIDSRAFINRQIALYFSSKGGGSLGPSGASEEIGEKKLIQLMDIMRTYNSRCD